MTTRNHPHTPQLMAFPHTIEAQLTVGVLGAHLLIRQAPIQDVLLGQREFYA